MLADVVQPLKTVASCHLWQHKLMISLQPALVLVNAVSSLPLDQGEVNDRFQVICRRYERGSIMVTRYKAFAAWAAWLGDAVLSMHGRYIWANSSTYYDQCSRPVGVKSIRIEHWIGCSIMGKVLRPIHVYEKLYL
jgi:hypothetical protein